MSSYIGTVEIGNQSYPIGSTLYGFCNTDANVADKKIVLSEFNLLLDGITIHIKFIKGNTASSAVTLLFYPSDPHSAQPGTTISPNMDNVTPVSVTGNFICGTNSIISFTLDGDNTPKYWRVNDSFKVEEGSTNGTIIINGEVVSVHGLGTAAYESASTFATAANPTFSGTATFEGPAVFESTVTLPGNPSTSLEAATKLYVDTKTLGLEGLSSAMIFRGVLDDVGGNEVTNGGIESPTIDGTLLTNKVAGDVVLYGLQEFVWNGNTWQLFGDEGSYALKTSATTITEVANLESVSVGSASGWNAGGLASLTIANDTNTAAALTTIEYSIPLVTLAGTPMRATVAHGVLTLTEGTPTELGTNFTVLGVNVFTPNIPANITFTPNTLPQLTVSPTNVSRITTNDVRVVVPDNANNNNNNENNP